MLTRGEMIGVILHERRTARQTLAHDFHGAHQSGGLPVALAGESVALSHQALRPKAWKLAQAVQVLECRREALEAALVEEGAQAQFEPHPIEQRFVPGA